MLKLCKNKLPLVNGKCRTKFVRKKLNSRKIVAAELIVKNVMQLLGLMVQISVMLYF